MSKSNIVYECFVPHVEYSKACLNKYLIGTDTTIIYLSSHGKYLYKNNKIVKLIESIQKSYELNGIYINEKEKSYINVYYLPHDIKTLLCTTTKYVCNNINMFIEQYHVFNKENISSTIQENIWFEIDRLIDNSSLHYNMSSFITNINIG